MATETFITQQDLKDDTVIQNNLESKLVAPFIQVAQDIHIVKILGKALSDALLADLVINAEGITEAVAARFITLLPYVKKAHNYCTAGEATPFLAVRITNKGVNRRSSDHSSPASENEVKGIKIKFDNYAQYYKKQLECFLLDNESTYPEFRQDDADCEDDCITSRSQYFSGFQFDKQTINKDLLG